ncbi:MAG: C40 family peptidase [Treponema sp.]|nr:C40 family peptidase [Treponema sp.]
MIIFSQSVFATVPERALRGISAADARHNLIVTAESFLGTPYRYAGIDRGGLDCSGLVFLSFWESFNVEVPRTAEGIYRWAETIDREELQPGDLVFFVTVGTAVSHVGIYVGNGRFIHSASEGPNTGVIYSRLDESYWRRTYRGAGRALPRDTAGAVALLPRQRNWSDPGFFLGFAGAWTWGGFFEGAPSSFRGISGMATAGYKWLRYSAGFEVRQEWDRALGVYRVPVSISFGTDTSRIFGGPAYTFGEPTLSLADSDRRYLRAILWEAGTSLALPPVRIGPGALSLYGELAYRHFRPIEGDFHWRPDLTANLRLSTGIRYLWKVQNFL